MRDRSVYSAMAAGVVLRVLPLTLWSPNSCTRDECTYRQLAQGIVSGHGMTPHEGWLWAPGWPYVLAVFQAVLGTAFAGKGLQIAASVLSILLIARLTRRLADDRAARAAAWMLALHPTFIYFAGTLFSEVLYTALLLSAVLALLWSREDGPRRALVAGALVGTCVLFRGVATYMLPIFMVAAVWPAIGEPIRTAFAARWRHAAAIALAAVLTVAPYSLYASHRYGGLVISDATLGQMMWLGDNGFPPISFDWGSGQLENRVFNANTRKGRPHCPKEMPAAKWDKCEVDHGVRWIKEHPAEFVRRIPLRLAQLVTPQTFLSRTLLWGKWPGTPWEVKWALLTGTIATSFAVILGGGAAGMVRGKGPFAVLAGGIVAYHLLAIAMLAGLSRYRLPLEPFGVVFLAIALSDPRGTVEAIRAQPWRALLAIAWIAVFLPLMLWLLPDAIPGWR